MYNLHRKLKDARLQAGLTRADVAFQIGRGEQLVFCYESGKITPPVNIMKKLCSIYGRDIGYFIDEDEKDFTVLEAIRGIDNALKEMIDDVKEIRAEVKKGGKNGK